MINFFISVTSHPLYLPPPCHKLSHLLGPSPPSSVTYFMDCPKGKTPKRTNFRIVTSRASRSSASVKPAIQVSIKAS